MVSTHEPGGTAPRKGGRDSCRLPDAVTPPSQGRFHHQSSRLEVVRAVGDGTAEVVAPGLARFRDAVEAACGVPALLAGSGSAYAAVVADRDAAGAAVRALDGRDGMRAWAGRGPVPA